ncbi:uncharacterized protein si:ch211-150o23.3 isoform X2 [Sander lucioperca]|uniref:uncharacterized protein si:ch211-150o23.3 isoform X2 n=1 Tax=Sander lucioperca TaxID=283035 RepID=UPI001653B021|nr:uncharacterized protein si:ch211-150o23.3 isoform X2 [Sander lucioperca]
MEKKSYYGDCHPDSSTFSLYLFSRQELIVCQRVSIGQLSIMSFTLHPHRLLGVLWDGVTAFGGVRLVDGENKCSGRVEVLLHNQWGTVCDHGWDPREANVVCLELGCGLAEFTPHGAVYGAGSGPIWLRHVQCSGHESSLTRCAVDLHSNAYCTHENDAVVKCSGTLLMPTLTLLSPHTVFSPGEAVRFSCSVLQGHLSDFHLYKHGVSTPLVTQRADQTQKKAELTLSDIETFHQGSYSCQYRIKSGFPSQLLSSPPSNSINIIVAVPWRFLPAASDPLQRHSAPVPACPHTVRHFHFSQRPELQRGLLLLPVSGPAGWAHLCLQRKPTPANSHQRPRSSTESNGDQLACVRPDICRSCHRFNHCGQGAV